MTIMTARYAGKCSITGKRFAAGATIDYNLITKSATLVGTASDSPASFDRPPEGRYLSNVYRSSEGKEYYRNSRGCCEDAPCCGCCNI